MLRRVVAQTCEAHRQSAAALRELEQAPRLRPAWLHTRPTPPRPGSASATVGGAGQWWEKEHSAAARGPVQRAPGGPGIAKPTSMDRSWRARRDSWTERNFGMTAIMIVELPACFAGLETDREVGNPNPIAIATATDDAKKPVQAALAPRQG